MNGFKARVLTAARARVNGLEARVLTAARLRVNGFKTSGFVAVWGRP